MLLLTVGGLKVIIVPAGNAGVGALPIESSTVSVPPVPPPGGDLNEIVVVTGADGKPLVSLNVAGAVATLSKFGAHACTVRVEVPEVAEPVVAPVPVADMLNV